MYVFLDVAQDEINVFSTLLTSRFPRSSAIRSLDSINKKSQSNYTFIIFNLVIKTETKTQQRVLHSNNLTATITSKQTVLKDS